MIVLCFILFLFGIVTPAVAQTLQSGVMYYIIIKDNLGADAEPLIIRGKTPGNGHAHDSIILPPNTAFTEWLYDPLTRQSAVVSYVTPDNGGRFELPPFTLSGNTPSDSDADLLDGIAEWIIGTDAANADTDADGIPDGVEVQQGGNPLSDLAVATGTLATVSTPGVAVDVATANNLAVVANRTAGISVFNVFAGLSPTLVAQVPLAGSVERVALSGNYVLTAQGNSGWSIIDISDAPNAQLIHAMSFGENITAVAASAGIGFAGTAGGKIFSIDLRSGQILDEVRLSAAITDLNFQGGILGALSSGTTYFLQVDTAEILLPALGSAAIGGKRLMLANDLVYVTHGNGFAIINISNPAAPQIIASANSGQIGWQQLVSNGAGLGIAATGVTAPDDIYLYDLSNPADNSRFVTSLPTPGQPNALSIYNGLAYVADGSAGLSVVNYIAYDNKKVPPTISLQASFPLSPAQAEEGKGVTIEATVTDDVQVRNVEFYTDGQRAATDGNFPFEYSFITPLLTTNKTNFAIRARATDTGGNSTWSDEISVQLINDITPPRVRRTSPAPSSILGEMNSITAFFNEPLDAASVVTGAFTLRVAGPDNVAGTADDIAVSIGSLNYREELRAITATTTQNLSPGLYIAQIGPTIRDRAGNLMAAPHLWSFWIFGGADADQDGIPDNVEAALGYDPTKRDSNNNNIADGDEDLDADGLTNRWEFLWGLNPQVKDTDGDGINDDLEDGDFDGFSNRSEMLAGTNPNLIDSDGDGWDDPTEVAEGTDPTRADSGARLLISSRDVAYLNAAVLPVPASVQVFAQSRAASYLNAHAEPPPASITQVIFSRAASYLNSFVEPPPASVSTVIFTRPVSYVNAVYLTVPDQTPFFKVSPVISYWNQ